MTLPVVCLDARKTRQMSIGMKTYVDELCVRLPRVAPEFSFVALERGGNFGPAEQIALPLAMRLARPAATHLLSQYAPLLTPRPFAITIHDLIHLRYPEFFKTKVGPYYRTVVRAACARAARVITDDQRTVADLERFLGVRSGKVCVIPLGVHERYFALAEPFRGPRPYLLYVGNHRTHKDLPTLFDAWSSLDERHALDLYLTGPDDFDGELQRRSSSTRRIIALGDVAPSMLIEYYRGASALVHPALREGFGLPLLEAMAAGCPVIACADALPSVLASAALSFPAGDSTALRAELEHLFDDQGLRRHLVNHGEGAARTYSWDRCARATADVYRVMIEEWR
jgi:glycosyltransferase involved in cell wall biosynthesis